MANQKLTALANASRRDGKLYGVEDGQSKAFPAALLGGRNRLINGNGAINQRAPTTNADDTYCVDRHYILTQTGTVAVSVLSDVTDGLPSMMRLTQSQAWAQRMGVAQIIEGANCKDLRGAVSTLLGKVRCSAAQAIRYAVLEWTGTVDAVTSDVVNSWTNGTFTAGQFFNSTTLNVLATGAITPAAATVTDFLLPATLGSSANNIIVFIWTEGTAAQNVTLDVAWQFAKGDLTGQTYPIEVRSSQQELALCQRHMRKSYSLGTAPGTATTTGQLLRKLDTTQTFNFLAQVSFSPPMLGSPTVTLYNPNDGNTFNPVRTNFGTDHPAQVLAAGDGGFIVEVGNSLTAATSNIATQYTAVAEL